jgi:alpha-1,6-mannosyltransferase
LVSADVTLAPGPIETFCLAALESISAGTPVVASNTSAVGEVLNASGVEPAGFVARNSAVDFADAILRVLSHEQMRIFARTQAENFSWETTVKKILELQSDSKFGDFEKNERSIA